MSDSASLGEGASVPRGVGETPIWFPQNFDPTTGRVLLVHRDPGNYRAASFLDARSLPPGFERRVVAWPALAAALPARAREDAQFIFHIGHVGSTLISRLLGELDGVLALREPLLLRIFADLPPPARAEVRLPLIKLLSRTFRADQRALIKATSFTSEVAAELLPTGSRTLFLHVSPRRYIEGILAGDASRQELRVLAPARRERLRSRCAGLADPEPSEAAAAALAWACEMTSLVRNEAKIGAARVMWMDFDRFLADPSARLIEIAAFLGHSVGADAAAALCAGPLMRRYSKALEYAYSPALRREVLADAARRHGQAIARALDWLEGAAARSPLLAQALSGRFSASHSG